MIYISPTINVLNKSIRNIGRKLLRDFNEVENLQNSIKSIQPFLNKTKLKLKKQIEFDLKRIKKNYDICFFDENLSYESEDTWIVDVLNGSSNFQKAIPHFCIAIGLIEKKETIISSIYDPIKDELYFSQKGKGSYINEYRLKLTEKSSVNLSTIAVSRISTINNSKKMKIIFDKFDQIRIFGCDLLDFCYLANGKIDAVVFQDAKKSNLEIGKIITKEASAIIIENIEGSEYSISCNKNMEREIRNILSEKVEI